MDDIRENLDNDLDERLLELAFGPRVVEKPGQSETRESKAGDSSPGVGALGQPRAEGRHGAGLPGESRQRRKREVERFRRLLRSGRDRPAGRVDTEEWGPLGPLEHGDGDSLRLDPPDDLGPRGTPGGGRGGGG